MYFNLYICSFVLCVKIVMCKVTTQTLHAIINTTTSLSTLQSLLIYCQLNHIPGDYISNLCQSKTSWPSGHLRRVCLQFNILSLNSPLRFLDCLWHWWTQTTREKENTKYKTLSLNHDHTGKTTKLGKIFTATCRLK